MDTIVRAFPLLPGKEREMRDFARAIKTERAAEAVEFYERFGIGRESWHLQETSQGTWVIGVTEITERPIAEAADAYAGSQHPFDRWFKSQVLHLTGIDPDTAPLGPPTECLFDTAELPPRGGG